jgi:hypothetical protein
MFTILKEVLNHIKLEVGSMLKKEGGGWGWLDGSAGTAQG